ncbi:MAG TPA: TonB-dependent siderophore receptor [Burkholderiaceae bacterium]|nr:TonB-dependent siderophore receptor [Burkholderiaceae bacterium]
MPGITVTPDAESAIGPVQGFAAKRSVSATKTDTPLIETPQAISVITRDQMEAQGVQALRDTAAYSAGVAASFFDSRGDAIKIRGTDPAQYLDGLQRVYGVYNTTRPDPFTLERVELLRGPSSVLYGQGSVGGVLNLVSKRPLAQAQRELQVQIGNHARKQLAVDFTGPLDGEGQWLYRLVAVGRDSGTQVDHVPDDRLVFAPSLTWQPSADTSLTLQLLHQKDKSGSLIGFFPWQGTLLPSLHGQIPTSTFISEPGFDRFDTEQTSAGWLFSHRVNDAWTVRQNFRATKSEADYRTLYTSFTANRATGRPARPMFNADAMTVDRDLVVQLNGGKMLVLDNQAEARFKAGGMDHTLLVGVDVQRNETSQSLFRGTAPAINVYAPVYGNYVAPTSFTPQPGVVQRQLGVYAQNQMKFGRWVGLLGLRHDAAKTDTEGRPAAAVDDQANTKRAGLVYLADGGWAPYLSYAESFLPLGGVDVYGTPFKPQRGKQWEAGLKWEPPGGRTSFLAAIYDLRDTNRKTTDPGNPLNSIQTGEVHAKGLELEAKGSFTGGWSATAAYAYTDARVSRSSGADLGKRLASVPTRSASAWLMRRLSIGGTSGFTLGAGVRYIGESWDGTDTLRTPPATLLDALLAWDNGPLRLALNVNNLTDKVQITTCLARGDCFYGQRRTLVASARYIF